MEKKVKVSDFLWEKLSPSNIIDNLKSSLNFLSFETFSHQKSKKSSKFKSEEIFSV